MKFDVIHKGGFGTVYDIDLKKMKEPKAKSTKPLVVKYQFRKLPSDKTARKEVEKQFVAEKQDEYTKNQLLSKEEYFISNFGCYFEIVTLYPRGIQGEI